MRNLLLLMLIGCLLTGCLGDIVLGGGKTAPRSQPEPLRDAETGKVIEMWVPKEGMIPSKVWESRARVEEEKCSNAYYIGKNVASLFPSQKGVYKILPRYGNRIWAYYYYYYGEDTPGFDTTDWYETVFNIYAAPNGRIYGCYWQKYPLGWVEKHGTTGGVIAPYP